MKDNLKHSSTKLKILCESFQTLMMYLWKPNLEIYGLEHVQTHQVLGDMAGLRVSKNKTIKYDSKLE